MNRNIIKAVIALIILSANGCFIGDRAADRTLNLYQLQSMNNLGAFEIDASLLPADAVESRTEKTGDAGPVTSLKIRIDYPVKVMLVPATQQSAGRRAE